ncbi:hypothetical protein [Methylophilus sp.]|uniref:hypothetical protein n=1 Tax=Methylophilus sp. TaxID=29541 RepID=UPI0025F2C297|nr:hypothetical protein [Methylophilus sp.]
MSPTPSGLVGVTQYEASCNVMGLDGDCTDSLSRPSQKAPFLISHHTLRHAI